MTEIDYQDRTSGAGQHAASGTMDAIGTAASDTAGTAKEQTREVVSEVRAQARSLASDAKRRIGTEAQGQNDRLADGLRHVADELDEMVEGRDDSPARSVVSQVASGGRRAADYLAEHGPDGVLQELQDFARRRPGTFLLVAAAAGFVAGRLGKGVLSAASAGKPDTASDASGPARSAPMAYTPAASVGYAPPAGDGYVQPAPAGDIQSVVGGYTEPVVGGNGGYAGPDTDLPSRRP